MNISKTQQRVLHALAQGGRIDLVREEDKVMGVECWSHEGWLLTDCTLGLFKSLKRKKLIASTASREVAKEIISGLSPAADSTSWLRTFSLLST